MPTVKVYPQGVALSRPRSASQPPASRRGAIDGWTSQAAARHLSWLMSVDTRALQGRTLYAFTLTVAVTPPSPELWSRAINAWLVRVRRAIPGVLYCWVVEWQGRGAPHLHGILAVPAGTPAAAVPLLVRHGWCEVASAFGARPAAQDCKRSDGTSGWYQYMGKHSGRSARHHQRSGKPSGWASTGRLWAHSRGWPTRQAVIDLPLPAWYQVRRILHNWAISDARRDQDPASRRRRLNYLRRRRRIQRDRSPWVGLREWAPEIVTLQALDWAAANYPDVATVDQQTGEIIAW